MISTRGRKRFRPLSFVVQRQPRYRKGGHLTVHNALRANRTESVRCDEPKGARFSLDSEHIFLYSLDEDVNRDLQRNLPEQAPSLQRDSFARVHAEVGPYYMSLSMPISLQSTKSHSSHTLLLRLVIAAAIVAVVTSSVAQSQFVFKNPGPAATDQLLKDLKNGAVVVAVSFRPGMKTLRFCRTFETNWGVRSKASTFRMAKPCLRGLKQIPTSS